MSTLTPNVGRGPYEIFLAVHNPDSPLATQLYDRLAAEGYRVFFYQRSNSPGDTWQESIERALEQVHTFLVLLTDAAPAGWTAAEVRAAQRRQISDPEHFRIIPVLAMENGMAPKSLGVFLDDAHRCELHVSKQRVEPDDLARLMDTLRDRSPGPTNLRIVDEPYRGLEVYRTEDQLLFCGRDRETSELVEELRTNRWIQVEGGSGSGKSSLVRAGLMPALTRRLRDANDADWMFLTMRPGGNPVKELAAALLDLEPENRSFGRLTDLEDKLWKSPDSLANIVREWNTLNQRVRPRPILLLVDQFEELFTQASDALPAKSSRREGVGQLSPQDQFVALLEAALSDKNGHLSLVTTIRSDFLHLVTQHEVLSQKLNYAKRYVLGPIAGSELRRCILDPLRMAGGRDAPDELVKRMIEDTEAGPGRLPLLSHTLRSLWHAARRRGDHTPTLRFEDYEAIGGVGGAVTRSADELLHSLTPTQQQAARRMFLELVHPGRGVRDVRKTATREALLAAGGAEAEGVLLRLSGGAKAGPSAPALPRLLVADQSAALPGHPEMVDLIHDSLVDRWGTLRGWLDEARRDLERRIDLEAAATAWANAGSLTSDLPSPGLTAYYTKWDGDPPSVSKTGQQYLQAAHRRHRGQRKLVIGALAGTGAAAVLFAALALWAMDQRRIAISAAEKELESTKKVNDLTRREAINLALAEEQRTQAQRNNARRAMERGVSLCEFGDRRGGMLWLARGLEIAHALGDAGLEHSFRLLLAGWNPFHERLAMFEHDATVFSVAYSPDGTKILTGSWDKTAQLWDVEARRRIGAPMRHEGQVDFVAFSGDGKLVLTRSEHEVRVWSADDGTAVGGPFTHDEKIAAAVFSPDGKTVFTGSHDTTAKLWSVATGEEVLSLPHDEYVDVVAFSPDGKTLLTGEWDVGEAGVNARLWNAASGDVVGKPMAHRGAVAALAFRPDSKFVVTASGSTAQIWDAATGESIGSAMSHDMAISSVAFNPDGTVLATGSYDKTAKLWDAHAGTLLVDPLQHEYAVWTLAFSPDGETLLTGTAAPIPLQRGELGLWDVARGASLGLPIQFPERINSVAFSPDGGYFLAGSHDGAASLWRVGEGRTIGTPKAHPAPVGDVAFSADGGAVLTACYDGSVRVWDVKTDKQIGKTIQHPRDYSLSAFSADGKKAFTGGGDEDAGVGILWDALTGQQIGKTLDHNESIRCAAFSPDGNLIVTGSRSFARLWDARTGEPMGDPFEHQGTVHAVAFSPDGKRFVVGSGALIFTTTGEFKKDGQARIWDVVTRKPFGKVVQQELAIRTVAFSQDGKTFLTGSEDKTAQLWDAATGTRIGETLRHQHTVTFVAISPDNRIAATVSEDGIAQIWDARTGKPLAEPLKRDSAVRSVAFSPDSKLLLTASFDGARLWEVSSGKLLSTPNRSSGAVLGVSFRPDGKSFATASGYRFQEDDGDVQQGGEMQIWRVPTPMAADPKQIMRWTNVYAGLELTPQELTVEIDQPTRLKLWRELTEQP